MDILFWEYPERDIGGCVDLKELNALGMLYCRGVIYNP